MVFEPMHLFLVSRKWPFLKAKILKNDTNSWTSENPIIALTLWVLRAIGVDSPPFFHPY